MNKEMNRLENADMVTKFWQHNYYEHVNSEQKRSTDYIEANLLLWAEDNENPVNVKR